MCIRDSSYGMFLFSAFMALAIIGNNYFGLYIQDFIGLIQSMYSVFAIFSLSDFRLKELIFLNRPKFALLFCLFIMIIIFYWFNMMYAAIIFDSKRYRDSIMDEKAYGQSIEKVVRGILGRLMSVLTTLKQKLGLERKEPLPEE
eukprot:TRINITY_DN11017_c0_g1_i5.p2 TRINITY_DN11017_c0_g1~~TRINITY_DN11017_c0_g1_i5.p2  ORF type:complete len:144 (+),score=30.37 TRINITY_DN11017_c0_g1_i5:65-496(+)